jgi:hypothetical protein
MERLLTLREEGKVRQMAIEFTETNVPLLYFTQLFPLTDGDLKKIFLESQIEVIKKNLKGEKLLPKDFVSLSRIRARLAAIREKSQIAQNLSL